MEKGSTRVPVTFQLADPSKAEMLWVLENGPLPKTEVQNLPHELKADYLWGMAQAVQQVGQENFLELKASFLKSWWASLDGQTPSED